MKAGPVFDTLMVGTECSGIFKNYMFWEKVQFGHINAALTDYIQIEMFQTVNFFAYVWNIGIVFGDVSNMKKWEYTSIGVKFRETSIIIHIVRKIPINLVKMWVDNWYMLCIRDGE